MVAFVITAIAVVDIPKFYPREYTFIWVCMCINVYIQDLEGNILNHNSLRKRYILI